MFFWEIFLNKIKTFWRFPCGLVGIQANIQTNMPVKNQAKIHDKIRDRVVSQVLGAQGPK